MHKQACSLSLSSCCFQLQKTSSLPPDSLFNMGGSSRHWPDQNNRSRVQIYGRYKNRPLVHWLPAGFSTMLSHFYCWHGAEWDFETRALKWWSTVIKDRGKNTVKLVKNWGDWVTEGEVVALIHLPPVPRASWCHFLLHWLLFVRCGAPVASEDRGRPVRGVFFLCSRCLTTPQSRGSFTNK